MDRKLSTHQEVERLTRVAAAARCHLGEQVLALKHKLDVPSRIQGSVRKHPTGWLLGSLASGLGASLLFRRHREVPQENKKPRSFLFAILGLLLTTVRPFAKVWATDLLKDYLMGQALKKPFSFPFSRSGHY